MRKPKVGDIYVNGHWTDGYYFRVVAVTDDPHVSLKPPDVNQRHLEEDDGMVNVIDFGVPTMTFLSLGAALRWASYNMKAVPAPWMVAEHINLDSYRVDL